MMRHKQTDSSPGLRGTAVVLVLSATGLSVARSLAPRGVKVYGVDSTSMEIGHFSRWIKHDKRISYLPPGPKLLERLLEFGREQKHRPVLFNAGDPYMDFVAHNRDLLIEYYIIPESMSSRGASVFLNKRTFYERCQQLGVSLPVTFFPANENDAKDAANSLRYPAILKPSLGHLFRRKLRGRKLVEASNPKELLRYWRKFREWGADVVLQEVIPGPESSIYVAGLYTDSNMNCISLFTGRKIRQYPPLYGSGSYMKSEWSPKIAELSVDLIRRLGYRGICGTEYKWDHRDNSWKLIEVNCRPTLWFALTRAAGVDVVWDAYCDLIGHPNPINIGRQFNGICWQYLVRDIVSAFHILRSGDMSLREFVSTVVSPSKKEYAVLSRSDISTALAYPANSIAKSWQNFRGSAHQNSIQEKRKTGFSRAL